MDETVTPVAAPRTASEYRAAIDAMIAEIRRMNERMDRNRVEIDRLKQETEAIKAETAPIKARVRSRLDALLPR